MVTASHFHGYMRHLTECCTVLELLGLKTNYHAHVSTKVVNKYSELCKNIIFAEIID